MGQPYPDHYRLLGSPVDASAAHLKEAYRRLSRLYHPDLHQGSQASTTRFQVIASAYEELADPGRRAAYDRKLLLQDPLRMVDDPRTARALDTLDGIVQRLGRGRRALPARRRGRDLRVKTSLSLAVANLGGATKVKISYKTSCRACDATGSQRPGQDMICHVCDGHGSLRAGLKRSVQPCGFCDGRGHVILHPCTRCGGSTVMQDERLIDVQVPPRTRHRALLRVRGVGEPADGDGLPGDVLVEVHIDSHPLLTAEGDDLICDLPLSPIEALAGCVREVPALDGVRKLRVPAKSHSGQELRIANEGLLNAQGQRGDLRYRLLVDIPTDADHEAVAALATAEERVGLAAFARRRRFAEQLNKLKEP